jgi:predicted dehydrogenase
VRPVRLAVIGAGRLGGFHAQKAAAHGAVALVGVADPAAAARRRVAADCGCRAVADYRDLIGEIDAAIVAAPTGLHWEIGLDLLGAGVHLLMEKPLARTGREAAGLVAEAARRGAVLQVGHVERFNPAFTRAAAELQNAKYIEAVRTSGFTFRSTDVGVVLDLMIHDLDLVLSLVRGPLRRIDALGLSVLGGHEDVAHARLEFEDGCVATLAASRVSHEAARRMSVWSPAAFTAIDFAARKTSMVRPSDALREGMFDVNRLAPAEVDYYRAHLLDEHLPLEILQCEAVDALAAELDDFIESICAPRLPRVTGEHGSDAVAVAEQILASIDAHRWDAAEDGLSGPHLRPRRGVLPGPHWQPVARGTPLERKEAG